MNQYWMISASQDPRGDAATSVAASGAGSAPCALVTAATNPLPSPPPYSLHPPPPRGPPMLPLPMQQMYYTTGVPQGMPGMLPPHAMFYSPAGYYVPQPTLQWPRPHAPDPVYPPDMLPYGVVHRGPVAVTHASSLQPDVRSPGVAPSSFSRGLAVHTQPDVVAGAMPTARASVGYATAAAGDAGRKPLAGVTSAAGMDMQPRTPKRALSRPADPRIRAGGDDGGDDRGNLGHDGAAGASGDRLDPDDDSDVDADVDGDGGDDDEGGGDVDAAGVPTRQRRRTNNSFTADGDVTFCRFCDYSSESPMNVARHERSHTGLKPYACSHCPYRSSRYVRARAATGVATV